MTKFADDIRKIVGVDRDQSAAPTLEDLGGIPSVRGVGTQSNGGASSSTVSGTGPDSATTDSGYTSGLSTGVTDLNGSNTLNPNNQNSFIRDALAGKFSAADIIDGTAGPSMKTSNLDTFDGTGFEGGSLSSITATDCTSGKDLDIRTDGLLVPPEATLWPDGSTKTNEWTDPNTPPDTVGFVQGMYWGIDPGGGQQQAKDPQEAAGLAKTYLDANPAGGDTPPYTITGVNQSASMPTRYIVGFEVLAGASNRTFTIQTNSESCIGVPPTDPADCPASSKETQWPEDGDISLTYVDGKFVGSVYDSDITTEFSGQERSHVSFCMPGGRFGVIRAGRDGGTVIYETDTKGGDPKADTTARYYDKNGALAGALPSSAYQTFLPPGDS